MADTTSPPATIGDILRRAREAAGLSIREVERRSEGRIRNTYLSQLERHTIAQPKPQKLHELADIYGLPYEELAEAVGYVDVSSQMSPELRRLMKKAEKLAPSDIQKLIHVVDAFAKQAD
jgi:transcriptional regulator with XRE-family HTH domain